jgi:hypothetical protein
VDGIDLYSSRHGYVAYNVCAGSYAVDGSHRDCIQLADTVSGAPPTSDIEIAFNLAHGDTQGFTSFRPNPGRLRINIHDNTAVLSQPQGLGFYDGQDSRVTSNHVWTLPSALNRSSVNIVGGNTVESCNAAGAGAGKSAWADKCP